MPVEQTIHPTANVPIGTGDRYTVSGLLYQFLNDEVLPHHTIEALQFWEGLADILDTFGPRNQTLLDRRNQLQTQIDQFHEENPDADSATYQEMLEDIGYLLPEPDDVAADANILDEEISTLAAPQLVVPLMNARYAINAANARWGSLYDALYGSDIFPASTTPTKGYDPERGEQVIAYAREFLDEAFPLNAGSHADATQYQVYFQNMLVYLKDGSTTELKDPSQYVGLNGSQSDPECILLRNNGLHVELRFDRSSSVGSHDQAGLCDIVVEAAVTSIMDGEDSVAVVDVDDKVQLYRNWLGLIRGDLSATFIKNGAPYTRTLQADRVYTGRDRQPYVLPGQGLMLLRNTGLSMMSDAVTTPGNDPLPEGILDAVATSLIASIHTQRPSRGRSESIYIVKPKLHGPDEVAFTVDLMSAVESLLGLQPNTIKLGIMDEERRTTVNLKRCIAEAKDRVAFINTGFLDRTGDEIHTSMRAGAFLPKASIKEKPWIDAYEQHNVDVGLACGLSGHAQIGKGMWPAPESMADMMASKISHLEAGATTSWVPSPTAATLHALHYHHVDVFGVHDELKDRPKAKISDILTIPLLGADHGLSTEEIERELEANLHAILGYVVRWIDQGIGCSTVPNRDNVGLMEDRATLRISSQLVSNWLQHGICSDDQIVAAMDRMARLVDSQNQAKTDPGQPPYQNMVDGNQRSLAFEAADQLVRTGHLEPNGYTEPVLHLYRKKQKALTTRTEH